VETCGLSTARLQDGGATVKAPHLHRAISCPTAKRKERKCALDQSEQRRGKLWRTTFGSAVFIVMGFVLASRWGFRVLQARIYISTRVSAVLTFSFDGANISASQVHRADIVSDRRLVRSHLLYGGVYTCKWSACWGRTMSDTPQDGRSPIQGTVAECCMNRGFEDG
jgi:hypothetical protein